MKKVLFTLIVVLSIFITSHLTSTISYADTHYYIDNYTINIAINPDGSADIEELIMYDFDGEFNGIFRDIDFSKTGGIENVGVFVKQNNTLVEFNLNSTSDIDEGGKNGTYNYVKEDEIAHFKIFERSLNEKKIFVFRYTFKDVVSKYNDIAEFNRKMVDSNWDVKLNNITINFTIPKGASKDNIRVFGHGSLLGESRIIDERHVEFTVPLVKPGEMAETRVLFPTELVPQVNNIVNKDALPEILALEKKFAEEANRKREEAIKQLEKKSKMRSIGNYISLIPAAVWFIAVVWLYIKFDKERKANFKGKYLRELPGDYTPAEMSVLLSHNVGTKDITATLMDLVRKKQLLLTTKKSYKKGVFKDKEESEYIVTRNTNAPIVTLRKHEAFLLKWFIDRIGDGNSLNLDEIADYTKAQSNAKKFTNDYSEWCDLAKKEADKNDFFDASSKKGTITGMLLAGVYILVGLAMFFIFGSIAAFVLIAQAVILFVYSAFINKRTAYGNEQKAMWIAFKNFLKDFSRLDKAVIPSIVIWEHYLVYAISLGIAKEVIKQLSQVYSVADFSDNRLTYMYGYSSYANLAILSYSLDRTVNSVDNAISNAVSVANSTMSSASGSGGGFSAGSSGGGGGGGGGGAF